MFFGAKFRLRSRFFSASN